MRIGIFGGDASPEAGTVDGIVAAARKAADDGFSTYWLPQIFGPDALTMLAVIGREVPGIELGTSVIPTYPRHPMALAAQALTTNAASGGRLVLGIGLSHQIVIESMFGYSFDKPVRHMKEYLTVLGPLLRGEPVRFTGESLSCAGQITVAGASPCPVLVAALGPQMLRLAGSMTDGTITWMTGPATLKGHTVPALAAAAEEAGRPAPRVAAGLPVCVTDDVTAARERAATSFSIYGQLPSYRAMLDREGAAGPADVAIVGDEDAVRAQLDELEASGATDFVAAEFGASSEERERTRALLKSVA
jgi:F420-dependent oxidoreductase-like protein